MVLRHPYIEFFNQTKRACEVGLAVASKHGLGGRDSLILANFLANKVPVILTRDNELLSLKEIAWRDHCLKIRDPMQG